MGHQVLQHEPTTDSHDDSFFDAHQFPMHRSRVRLLRTRWRGGLHSDLYVRKINSPLILIANVKGTRKYIIFTNFRKGRNVLMNDCNENCGCDESFFFPVCGTDNKTYFSGCLAGCSHKGLQQGIEVSSVFIVFSLDDLHSEFLMYSEIIRSFLLKKLHLFSILIFFCILRLYPGVAEL